MNLVMTALLGLGVLSASSLAWGSFLFQQPQRIHLAALTAVLVLVAVVLVAARGRGTPYRVAARVLSATLFLVIGLGLGGWDHLMRVVLTGHGLPGFGPTGDLAYEALGILLLPLGLASLTTLKALAPAKEEE